MWQCKDNENRSIEKFFEIMKALKPYQSEPEQEASETDTVESDAESFEAEGSYDENTVLKQKEVMMKIL